jgi:tetratricopeptide (TPR) repeat protein
MIKHALFIIWLAGVAAAQTPKQSAKQHLDAGVAAYQAQDFDTASKEFELAYTLDPDPKTLYAWAQAKRQSGQCDEAVRLYERYINGKPGDNNIAAAKTGISLCEQAMAAQPPAPPPAQPEPVTPTPPPAAAPVQAEPSRWYQDRIGDALVIGGVVGVAAGTTFLVLANKSDNAADTEPDRDKFIELLDQATLRRRIGGVCLGVGAALVIGGVVHYATRSDSAPVGVAVTTDSIAVVGRF